MKAISGIRFAQTESGSGENWEVCFLVIKFPKKGAGVSVPKENKHRSYIACYPYPNCRYDKHELLSDGTVFWYTRRDPIKITNSCSPARTPKKPHLNVPCKLHIPYAN